MNLLNILEVSLLKIIRWFYSKHNFSMSLNIQYQVQEYLQLMFWCDFGKSFLICYVVSHVHSVLNLLQYVRR